MTTSIHSKAAKICDVSGCSKEAERSINTKQFAKSSLTLKESGIRSVHLCKDHYKSYKKETKTSRELDQLY